MAEQTSIIERVDSELFEIASTLTMALFGEQFKIATFREISDVRAFYTKQPSAYRDLLETCRNLSGAIGEVLRERWLHRLLDAKNVVLLQAQHGGERATDDVKRLMGWIEVANEMCAASPHSLRAAVRDGDAVFWAIICLALKIDSAMWLDEGTQIALDIMALDIETSFTEYEVAKLMSTQLGAFGTAVYQFQLLQVPTYISVLGWIKFIMWIGARP